MTPSSSAPDRPGRSELPAPYPAPYVEPWGRLAVDLRAALASTVLKLREMVRRNREGDLSVPGFWPQSLAALFWPVLLALGVGVLALLVSLLIKTASPSSPIDEKTARASVQPDVEQVAPRADLPLAQATDQSLASSVGHTPSPPEPAAAALLELDPLLALLADDDPEGCIVSVSPHPDEGRLELELISSFAALPLQRRQQQADLWLERSSELGYERLRLVDSGGNLLGQAARVGTGMVLLEAETFPQP